jgi:hypothetical protein
MPPLPSKMEAVIVCYDKGNTHLTHGVPRPMCCICFCALPPGTGAVIVHDDKDKSRHEVPPPPPKNTQTSPTARALVFLLLTYMSASFPHC